MKKVLLPIDGSVRSLRSIKMARQFYDPGEAAFTILTVLSEEGAADPAAEKQAREELEDWSAMLEGYSVETAVRWGIPGPEIVRFAERGCFDAILMTRAGRGHRHKIGSVASHIVQEVPYMDVLVMHEDKN